MHSTTVEAQLGLKPSNPANDLCHGPVRRSNLLDHLLRAADEYGSEVRSLYQENYQI